MLFRQPVISDDVRAAASSAAGGRFGKQRIAISWRQSAISEKAEMKISQRHGMAMAAAASVAYSVSGQRQNNGEKANSVSKTKAGEK